MSGKDKINRSKRRTVNIPIGCRTDEFLKNNSKSSEWQALDKLLEQLPATKEEWAYELYDDFISRVTTIFPDIKDKLEVLRPLILWHIVSGEELTDDYYKKLKEL